VPCLSAFGALYKFTFTYTFTVRAGEKEGGLKSIIFLPVIKPAGAAVSSISKVSVTRYGN